MSSKIRMGGPKAFRKHRNKGRYPKTIKGKVSKLAANVSKLRKQIDTTVEVKNYDSFQAPFSVSWVGSLGLPTQFLNIPQGTTVTGRIGDKIKVTGIDANYRVNYPAGSAGFPQQIRVLLLLDKDIATLSGGLFTVGDILNRANTDLAPLSHFVRASRNHYKVLHDMVHDVDPVQDIQNTVRIRFKKPIEVEYEPGNPTPRKNALRWCMISDTNTVANMPLFRDNTRVWFVDA